MYVHTDVRSSRRRPPALAVASLLFTMSDAKAVGRSAEFGIQWTSRARTFTHEREKRRGSVQRARRYSCHWVTYYTFDTVQLNRPLFPGIIAAFVKRRNGRSCSSVLLFLVERTASRPRVDFVSRVILRLRFSRERGPINDFLRLSLV